MTASRPRLLTPPSPSSFSKLINAVEAAHDRKIRMSRSSSRRRRQRRDCCGALTKLLTIASAAAWIINAHSKAGSILYSQQRQQDEQRQQRSLFLPPETALALTPPPPPSPPTPDAVGKPLKMTLAFDPAIAAHLAKAAPMALYYYGRGAGGTVAAPTICDFGFEQWKHAVGWGGAAVAFVLWWSAYG